MERLVDTVAVDNSSPMLTLVYLLKFILYRMSGDLRKNLRETRGVVYKLQWRVLMSSQWRPASR